MLKKIFSVSIVSMALLFSANEMKAAGPPGPPGGGGTPGCWPPPCAVPIDGGISFLIVAGVALAGKKINDSRKKSV